MYVKHELTFDEMSDFLWGLARENWVEATEDERRYAWDMLEEAFYNEIPEDTKVNAAIAYDSDVFFPKDEDEEYDESLKRNKLESRIKRLEKLMLRK